MRALAPLVLALSGAPAGSPAPLELMPLFDFTDGSRASAWRPIHDGVMGGVSTGRALAGEKSVVFEGEVSLENNGGFASFRAATRLPDLSDQDGLRLRVRGDGQVYKLSLRTDGGWDGVSWQASFLAPAAWTTIDLAFEDLEPTWRGRLVREETRFDASSIRQVGLLIADEQEGAFRLELASMDAWQAGAGSARAGQRERSSALAEAVESGASAEALTEGMRWDERLVVVASPDDLDSEASKQLGHLLAAAEELAERELRIVHLRGRWGGRLAGRTLSTAQTHELREHWQIPPDRWTVALVGKDGGVKQRWSELVAPAEVFALVDAMPLRRRELRRRGELPGDPLPQGRCR